MKKLTYNYIILIHRADPRESGYWVEVPTLPGCFTQGETVEQCLALAEEAIRSYVVGLMQDGQHVPDDPRREDTLVTRLKIKITPPI